MAGDTLILGVGNPLCGDDAVGIRAVEALLQRDDLPPEVAVIDGGTEGIGLIPLMESYRRVILVDAAQMGLPPGAIRRFRWQDAEFAAHERALSLHQSDLSDALALAAALRCLPQEVVIYVVQPHTMGWDQPLSRAVERALPALIEALINEARSNSNGEDSDH